MGPTARHGWCDVVDEMVNQYRADMVSKLSTAFQDVRFFLWLDLSDA